MSNQIETNLKLNWDDEIVKSKETSAEIRRSEATLRRREWEAPPLGSSATFWRARLGEEHVRSRSSCDRI